MQGHCQGWLNKDLNEELNLNARVKSAFDCLVGDVVSPPDAEEFQDAQAIEPNHNPVTTVDNTAHAASSWLSCCQVGAAITCFCVAISLLVCLSISSLTECDKTEPIPCSSQQLRLKNINIFLLIVSCVLLLYPIVKAYVFCRDSVRTGVYVNNEAEPLLNP